MWYFLIALLFLQPLFAENDASDIVVHLPTESHLVPTYVAPIASTHSSYDAAFLRQLEEVLRFDLSHNGRMQLLPQTVERQAQVLQEADLASFSEPAWRALSISHVVKLEARDKTLSVSAYATGNKRVKILKALPLTGSLSRDRRTMHAVADALCEEFFGEKGIAQTRILYTVRTRSGSESTHWVTEVWEADYDGGNPRQVTREGSICLSPTYVPPLRGESASELLYVSYKLGQPKIFRAKLADGIGQRASGVAGNQFMPVASPKGDLLAFIADSMGNPDLFLQPAGPREKARRLFTAQHGTQGSPCFSPDGKRIAFVSNKDGSPRIYVLSLASGDAAKVHLITKINRENTSPAWSPDGSKLAYSAVQQGVRQIWIYDFKENREWQLTTGPTHKENPTWAPNSTHLVFNSSTPHSSELFLVNLHQKETVKISSGSGEKRFPAWEARGRL